MRDSSFKLTKLLGNFHASNRATCGAADILIHKLPFLFNTNEEQIYWPISTNIESINTVDFPTLSQFQSDFNGIHRKLICDYALSLLSNAYIGKSLFLLGVLYGSSATVLI